MSVVGLRALKQNASAVVADVVRGETVVITDRGRPVAQMTPLPTSPVEEWKSSGRVRAAQGRLADLPAPPTGAQLSPVLKQMREQERY